MRYPRLEIHRRRIEENARSLCGRLAARGIEVAGVTKGACGHPGVAQAMLDGGVSRIADSRLLNIRRMRSAGIAADMILLRLPMPSEVPLVPELVECSLNSEIDVIRALGDRAFALGRMHGVILMVDVGERREGVMPEHVRGMCRQIAGIHGIRLEALGTNVACLSGVLPTCENVKIVVDLARDVSRDLGFEVGVSGGNTATTILLEHGDLPGGVTGLRIGEGILLGTDLSNQRTVPGTRQDTFRLFAEVIEVQRKQSAPEGTIGVDAFGLRPWSTDRGPRLRAIVALGKQDVEIGGLMPCDPGIAVEGASSDHLVLDVEESAREVRPGAVLEFAVNYPALLRLMTSEYVEKVLLE